jgi:hypothetical protein
MVLLERDTAPPAFLLDDVGAEPDARVADIDLVRPFCQRPDLAVVFAAEGTPSVARAGSGVVFTLVRLPLPFAHRDFHLLPNLLLTNEWLDSNTHQRPVPQISILRLPLRFPHACTAARSTNVGWTCRDSLTSVV